MRNRPRADEPPAREPEREQSARVRVPKIQYRFLKEIEEKGVTNDARKDALAMADKIKRYPLEPAHVMGSWERFTKKAIEEFKDGRGKPEERDRQHTAYALVFASMRDNPPATDVDHLKARIKVTAESMAQGASRGPQQKQAPEQTQQQQPQQQNLIERERPLVDKQVDAVLVRLRELSPQLRSTIEASARELVIEGHYTAASAREALPAAVRELKADRSERNTVHTLTLAVIAKVPEHRVLLDEVKQMGRDQRKEVEHEARARLERYPPLETGIADVKKDAIAAAVRDAVEPSGRAHREAIVLAQAREEIEAVADPRRMSWQNVGDELASDLP